MPGFPLIRTWPTSWGAFYDPAAEADAESMEELDDLEDEDAERS